MPISNGYEACVNIGQIFDEDKLFRQSKFKLIRPVIVACSSHIDDEVLLQTKLAGFDHAFSAPL